MKGALFLLLAMVVVTMQVSTLASGAKTDFGVSDIMVLEKSLDASVRSVPSTEIVLGSDKLQSTDTPTSVDELTRIIVTADAVVCERYHPVSQSKILTTVDPETSAMICSEDNGLTWHYDE